jgi:carbonic anhydrase/acetyltransferase-like protein (isoleucine patch superfamily)
MSGVTVGDGAVIAARACVVKNVMPYQIVGGNPAKPIKQRFDDQIIELLNKLRWWDLPLEVIREIKEKLCSQPKKEELLALISKYRA